MKYDYPEDGTGKIMVHQGLNRVRILRDILNFSLLIMLSVILIYCVTHDAKVVRGESMQPTINSSWDNDTQYDIVILNKTTSIDRGDIIIVDFSDYSVTTSLIIKRVIATAGDTINITWDGENQKLIVTLKKAGSEETEVLVENYIKKDANDPTKDDSQAYECASSFQLKDTGNGKYWNPESYTQNEDGSITIKEGYFFALGDNRGESYDCSELGPMLVSNVVGVVDTIVPNGTFLNYFLRTFFGLRL